MAACHLWLLGNPAQEGKHVSLCFLSCCLSLSESGAEGWSHLTLNWGLGCPMCPHVQAPGFNSKLSFHGVRSKTTALIQCSSYGLVRKTSVTLAQVFLSLEVHRQSRVRELRAEEAECLPSLASGNFSLLQFPLPISSQETRQPWVCLTCASCVASGMLLSPSVSLLPHLGEKSVVIWGYQIPFRVLPGSC